MRWISVVPVRMRMGSVRRTLSIVVPTGCLSGDDGSMRKMRAGTSLLSSGEGGEEALR